MNKIECFKIRLYKSKDIDLAHLNLTCPIFDIMCGTGSYTSRPVDIVADPFLFVYNDRLYLFYECKHMLEKGVLNMVSTCDLKSWTSPITILDEPFHLSYPNVFEIDGEVYMIPETEKSHSIRIYKAKDDTLTSFSLYKKILEHTDSSLIRTDYCDSSIIKKDDIYYLMTTVNYGKGNTLELYYSDRFDGEYIKHPMSPLMTNNKYGRCGGAPLNIDGKLYRVAQDCVNRYGDNVHVLQIETLTMDTYLERVIVDNLFDTATPYYKEGGHQLNIVKFRNSYIIATDAKEYRSFLVPRILKKLIK